MKLIKPNSPDQNVEPGIPTLFLAGSIDNGAAEKWQDEVARMLETTDVTIFNPRRDEWNADLVQDISNPDFAFQVNWELSHIEAADFILFYFSPSGPAPITLMELGTLAHRREINAIVCCPEGYWRRGNVQVFCARHEIALVSELHLAVQLTKSELDRRARKAS